MLKQSNRAWQNVTAKTPSEVLEILEPKRPGITHYYKTKSVFINIVFGLYLARNIFTSLLNMWAGKSVGLTFISLCFASVFLWSVCVLMKKGRWGYCCILLLLALPCYDVGVPYLIEFLNFAGKMGTLNVLLGLLSVWWEVLYILLSLLLLPFLVSLAVCYMGVAKNRMYASTFFYAAAQQHLESSYDPDAAKGT